MSISLQVANTLLSVSQQITPVYLGGSRRMNELCGAEHKPSPNPNPTLPTSLLGVENVCVNITELTDYDFYATHSSALEQFLLANGFTYTDFILKHGNDQHKTTCVGDYSLDDEAITVVQCENVQVVLRKDAEFYKAVFDNIQPWFYVKYLWKSTTEPAMIRTEIKPIFNMLFAIARAAATQKA